MHPNPVFRSDDHEKNLTFATARGFGVLSVNADPTPQFAHVPFVLSPDGATLDLHLVRSNPIAIGTKTSRAAAIVVSGPDGYVSPDWYGLIDQVPTWNYVAVHLFGTLERRPQDELRASIESLSNHYEELLLPKPIWKTDKVTPQVLDRMMRMIVPFRLTLTGSDGTWKLGQNKDDQARLSAAKHVGQHSVGQDSAAIAGLMAAFKKSE